MTTTRTLSTPDVDLVYDVHGPLPTADGRPPLLMIGQPMDASGFSALAGLTSERTVVTYDPRGLGRSVRKDGRTDHDPNVQAGDVRALIDAVGGAPVDVFASSGGAVTALALVAAHPDAVRTLVAHEPPSLRLLPDADLIARAQEQMDRQYQEHGWGAGMAAFVAFTSWEGELTEDFFAAGPPDPAQFGMPTDDDGSRDDPLLSGASAAVTEYEPDVEALRAAPTRVVVAVGEESAPTVTGRAAIALAGRLGQDAVVFPSHHGGFMSGEFGYAGQPEAFAERLREVLGSD